MIDGAEGAWQAEAVAAARSAERVVVSTFNAWTPGSSQVELVEQLPATGKPVVVAAVGTPHDTWPTCPARRPSSPA
jgi:beta-N-acetylhexosaminidase